MAVCHWVSKDGSIIFEVFKTIVADPMASQIAGAASLGGFL